MMEGLFWLVCHMDGDTIDWNEDVADPEGNLLKSATQTKRSLQLLHKGRRAKNITGGIYVRTEIT